MNIFVRTRIFIAALIFGCMVQSCESQATRCIKQKREKSFSVVMVMNEKSEVLLLRRQGKVFASGQYGLPGGKIEAGETALEGARRETMEEVGIEVKELQLVHVLDRQGSDDTEFYLFCFKAQSWIGAPCNKEPHKCSEIGWFALDSLPENVMPAHRHIIENVSKGLSYSTQGWDE